MPITRDVIGYDIVMVRRILLARNVAKDETSFAFASNIERAAHQGVPWRVYESISSGKLQACGHPQ